VDLVAALKTGGKGTGDAGGRGRLPSALIVAQVAVSVVLLIGAGLLLLSFYRVQQVETGYRGDRVLAAEIFANFSRYPDAASQLRLYQPLLERLEGSPGVVSAAITNGVPLSGLQPGQTPFQVEGQAVEPELRPTSSVSIASPRYFETLGIPVVRGRVFTVSDDRETLPVMVINQSMMRYWDGRDPIGSRVSINNGQTWCTVVGVVGDVKQFGLDREAVAQVYIPLAQMQFGLAARALVRMNGDPATAAAVIRDNVRALDPDMPIENVRTLDELRVASLSRRRLTALLLSVFAALALLVTVTGITGVIATSVSQRTQEFGLRMALGATRESVLRSVLGHGLLLVAGGLVIGIAAAIALSRVLQSYLFATTPTDPLAFAAVAAAFLLAGTLACLGPAWRATTVDPLIALRTE
jgi:putative ABC transport system permease protein